MISTPFSTAPACRIACIIVITGVFLLLCATDVIAQEEPAPKKNTIFVELGGNAVLYSFNYDRLLTDDISARAGIAYYSLEDDAGVSIEIAAVPLTVNYLLGEGSNKVEVGLGALFVSGKLDLGTLSDSGVLGTGVLGYRRQKPEGGFMFKAGITPVFGKGAFLFWVGAGIGYSF